CRGDRHHEQAVTGAGRARQRQPVAAGRGARLGGPVVAGGGDRQILPGGCAALLGVVRQGRGSNQQGGGGAAHDAGGQRYTGVGGVAQQVDVVIAGGGC